MAVFTERPTPRVKCRMCDSLIDAYEVDYEMLRHTIFGSEIFWSSEGCDFPPRVWQAHLRRDERTGKVRYKHSCGCEWIRIAGGEALCIEATPQSFEVWSHV
jgi:hypothetical protein